MSAAELHVENGTARLSGDLTFATVAGLHEQMLEIAKSGGLPALIDLSGVGQIDSAGLALLLEWQSAYRRQSGDGNFMAVLEPPQALLKIARLCEAEEYLQAGAKTEAHDEGR